MDAEGFAAAADQVMQPLVNAVGRLVDTLTVHHTATMQRMADNHTAHMAALREAKEARVAASVRPKELSKCDAKSWKNWRASFETAVSINRWSNFTARQQLAYAMSGSARETVAHVPTGADAANPGAAQPVDALLDLYEAKFCPASAGRMAEAEYNLATQMEDETVQLWSNRLLALFSTAYPNRAADFDNARDLVSKFVDRLVSPEMRKQVNLSAPATYTEALEAANVVQASVIVTQAPGRSHRGPSTSKAGLYAMAERSTEGGRKEETRHCYRCNRPGHLAKDCYSKTVVGASPLATSRGRGGRGGSRGRGGSGTGRGASAGRNRTGRDHPYAGVHALGAEGEPSSAPLTGANEETQGNY